MSVRTAYKWLRRFREEGERGLVDRSSRPHHCPHALPEATRAHIVAARTERQTYRQISQSLNVSHSSVGRVLVRQGLNRLASLEPAPPVERYEYDAPGGMLHLDIKKLGRFERPGHRVTADRSVHTRGAGWEYVHIAIDDHTRLATASVLPDETARSACRALLDAIRHYRRLGIRFVRVLTDNGVAYRSRLFGRLCRRLGIRHTFTKPYTPRTNGKAERVIQTALREWAYARRYESSAQRSEHLPGWLHRYNWHRPHASLGYLPPVSRLSSLNNLVGLHS